MDTLWLPVYILYTYSSVTKWSRRCPTNAGEEICSKPQTWHWGGERNMKKLTFGQEAATRSLISAKIKACGKVALGQQNRGKPPAPFPSFSTVPTFRSSSSPPTKCLRSSSPAPTQPCREREIWEKKGGEATAVCRIHLIVLFFIVWFREDRSLRFIDRNHFCTQEYLL